MRILVSACLLGLPCRYDGQSKPNEAVLALAKTHELIPVCPECYGGLPTPRTPSERWAGGVFTADGIDVTAQYQRGAQAALLLAQQLEIHTAILKERSPACGHGAIYDGSFTRQLIPGEGVAAELLLQHGLQVFGESDLDALNP